MRVSILSDEISRDPLSACELAADWGIKHLEFRMYMKERAPRGMSEAEMQQVAKAAADFGLDFPSVSPGLFKVRMADPAIEEHRGEFRERCLDLAEVLGAGILVVFPPVRSEGDGFSDWSQQIVDDLRETAELAAQRGLTVALENEPVCYGGSGQSLAALLDETDHPASGANWDPGNHCSATKEDFRGGYASLRDKIVHCHVKDVRWDEQGGRKTVPPGEGDVDWAGQIAALKADDYDGLLVLETHFTPKIAGSRDCFRRLTELLEQAGERVE